MVKQNIKNNFPSSPKVIKMKQGMSYSPKEKTIIMNVFKYFRAQYSDKNLTEVVRCTSQATGCSEKSIFLFRKEEISPQGFKEPSKTKVRKKVNANNRLIKYTESIRQVIKNTIYDLKTKNTIPSLSIILKNLKANDSIPRFSLMTLRRLLFDMGFYYEKKGNKSILVEKKGANEVINETSRSIENNQCLKLSQSDNISLQNETGHREGTEKKDTLLKANFNPPPPESYGPTAGIYSNSMDLNPSPHLSLMVGPRMPQYPVHSSHRPYLFTNKELYLKEISPGAPHTSQINLYNTVLH